MIYYFVLNEIMKSKYLNLSLIITSFIGYLEWGGGMHSFLIEVEGEILLSVFHNPKKVLHPFILLPFLGQIFLFMTLFQKPPAKILTVSGIICLGILFLFMLIVGCISLNWKISVSTFPFLILSFYTLVQISKRKNSTNLNL